MSSHYGMSYKGWNFYSEWEEEVDKHNKKLWHYIIDPDGNEYPATIGGSYTFPNTTDVHKYIDELIARTKEKN